MTVQSRRTLCAAAIVLLLCLLGVGVVRAQAPAERAPLSDEVFKNVQLMKGIPVDQFMASMGFFSASLGMSCEDCHAADDRSWEGFAADNPRKQTARRMIGMMQKINADNFGGRQLVTCYSCHRGADTPRAVPDFSVQYGPLLPPDPNSVFAQAKLAPMADEVFNKYIQAVGGAQRAAALTSIVATGSNVGYGPESADRRAVEMYAKAPAQRAVIVRTSNGESTTTYDGRNAWVSAPLRPVAVLALAGQELDGAKFDAMITFPSQIRQLANAWRVGVATTIDDKDVDVVQGNAPGGMVVTLYFDQKTGLLVRSVRYTASPVGRIPVQADYGDYREVAGVKIPHAFTLTWLDGRDTFELSNVRANVAVEATRFAKPAPSAAPRAAGR